MSDAHSRLIENFPKLKKYADGMISCLDKAIKGLPVDAEDEYPEVVSSLFTDIKRNQLKAQVQTSLQDAENSLSSLESAFKTACTTTDSVPFQVVELSQKVATALSDRLPDVMQKFDAITAQLGQALSTNDMKSIKQAVNQATDECLPDRHCALIILRVLDDFVSLSTFPELRSGYETALSTSTHVTDSTRNDFRTYAQCVLILQDISPDFEQLSQLFLAMESSGGYDPKTFQKKTEQVHFEKQLHQAYEKLSGWDLDKTFQFHKATLSPRAQRAMELIFDATGSSADPPLALSILDSAKVVSDMLDIACSAESQYVNFKTNAQKTTEINTKFLEMSARMYDAMMAHIRHLTHKMQQVEAKNVELTQALAPGGASGSPTTASTGGDASLVAELRRKLAEYEKKFKDGTQELGVAVAALKSMDIDLKKEKAQAESAKTRAETAEGLATKETARANAQETRAQQSEERERSMKARAEKAETEAGEQRSAKEAAEQEVVRLKLEAVKYTEALNNTTADKARIQGLLQAKTEENVRLQNVIDAIQGKSGKQVIASLEALRKDIADNTAEHGRLTATIREREAELTRVQEERDQFGSQLQVARLQIAAHEGDIKYKEAQIETKERAIEGRDAQLRVLTLQNEREQAEHAGCKEALDASEKGRVAAETFRDVLVKYMDIVLKQNMPHLRTVIDGQRAHEAQMRARLNEVRGLADLYFGTYQTCREFYGLNYSMKPPKAQRPPIVRNEFPAAPLVDDSDLQRRLRQPDMSPADADSLQDATDQADAAKKKLERAKEHMNAELERVDLALAADSPAIDAKRHEVELAEQAAQTAKAAADAAAAAVRAAVAAAAGVAP